MTNPDYSIPKILEGRLGLVTGAAQGIGRAIAFGLSQAGARVILTDIQEASLAAAADAICAQGGTAWSFELDVTQPDACVRLAEHIGAEIGRVDLLVNNAGINIREGNDSPNAAINWRRTFDVNVNGTFNVTQALLPALRATRGTILNVASLASLIGQVGSLGYSPSKGAIKMYTQTLAAELAPDGVRVNALAPGYIETPLNAEQRGKPGFLESRMTRIPMGRAGQPEDLAGPAVFLSSRMAGYITGVILPVDGGYLTI